MARLEPISGAAASVRLRAQAERPSAVRTLDFEEQPRHLRSGRQHPPRAQVGAAPGGEPEPDPDTDEDEREEDTRALSA
ncbi:MAG TPA: hypothetical protein VFT39_19780 [Vicinamibacterales bacterium]|nr:hypothetical protein [Vicinamibacterales bacterium]